MSQREPAPKREVMRKRGKDELPNPLVLVYGADGWIGRQVCEVLMADQRYEHLAYYASRVRRIGETDESLVDVQRELDTVRPTHAVCCIGRTHLGERGTIDDLETSGRTGWQRNLIDNLVAPMMLAEACAARRIHFTYFGTGCLFGPDGEPFDGSNYSFVKGCTDRLFRQLNAKRQVLQVRIRLPITADTEDPRNLLNKIWRYRNHLHSAPNSVSVLPELLPVLRAMMFERWTGTFNLVNPGSAPNAELFRLVYPEQPYSEVGVLTSDEVAAPRSNTQLDTSWQSTKRFKRLLRKHRVEAPREALAAVRKLTESAALTQTS